MATGKLLRLGGIDNSSPRTEQNPLKFRVAQNVIPTNRDTHIPRYHNGTSVLTNTRFVMNVTPYDTSVISMVREGFFKDTTAIPLGPNFSTIISSSALLTQSQTPSNYRQNNTIYYLIPQASKSSPCFVKYDGVQMSNAGTSMRRIMTNNISAAGTRFIRVVRHTVDFDNNEPVSDYIQFPSLSGTPTFKIGSAQGTPPGSFISLPDQTLPYVTPAIGYYETSSPEEAFYGTAVSGGSFITVTEASPFPSGARQNSYYVIYATAAEMAAVGFLQGQLALALKVTSAFGATLTLGLTDAKVMSSNREWVTQDVSAFAAAIASNFSYGTMSFLTVWESTAATGIYYFRKIAPYIGTVNPAGTANPNYFDVTTTGVNIASAGHDTNILTIAPSLNGWFDTNSLKLTPNANFDWGGTVGFFAMAQYQGNILLANDEYIWFSDSTLGGWIEQFEQSASLLIGSKEYGRITGICGTSDFLFVGRERRNYYVTGNIATGNYRTIEIDNCSVGPWCNKSSLSINNAIFFISSKGLYRISSGGKAEHLSRPIPASFRTYSDLDNMPYEDTIFKMIGEVSSLGLTDTLIGMDSTIDQYRGLLFFMKREATNPTLVVKVETGEIYEWNGLYPTTVTETFGNCISAIKSDLYVGGRDINAPGARRSATLVKETKTSPRAYLSQFPAKLYTSWLTAGEPSLEKEVLQLKIFGKVARNALGGLPTVKHYKDWDINTAITNSQYTPSTVGALATQVQFSHKKRLNSDKCLSVSVGIEINNQYADFEIDSLEVEFNPIQAGMKR